MTTKRSPGTANVLVRKLPCRARWPGPHSHRVCCGCRLWRPHGHAAWEMHQSPFSVSLSPFIFSFLFWLNLKPGNNVSVLGCSWQRSGCNNLQRSAARYREDARTLRKRVAPSLKSGSPRASRARWEWGRRPGHGGAGVPGKP